MLKSFRKCFKKGFINGVDQEQLLFIGTTHFNSPPRRVFYFCILDVRRFACLIFRRRKHFKCFKKKEKKPFQSWKILSNIVYIYFLGFSPTKSMLHVNFRNVSTLRGLIIVSRMKRRSFGRKP